MKDVSEVIRRLPKGGFKFYLWGSADDHIMDWRGCNFRVRTVDGQPHRGFATKEEALAYALERFPTHADAEHWARDGGDGSFFNDDLWETVVDERFLPRRKS